MMYLLITFFANSKLTVNCKGLERLFKRLVFIQGDDDDNDDDVDAIDAMLATKSRNNKNVTTVP